MITLSSHLRLIIPGVLLSTLIAAASTFISEHQGGSSFLYALLFGMALKSITNNAEIGITFSSKTILRIGVALLGFRISMEQITALGLNSALLVAAGVGLTILSGIVLSYVFKLNKNFGILTGGATAICGASAALAIASLLPNTKTSERDTSFAIVAVTALSTLLMVLYPPILQALNIDDPTSGFLIGATVHDVAQVVGAGYMISPEAGDLATLTKLFRVALLVPITMALLLVFRNNTESNGAKAAPIPWFLVLFMIFVGLRSLNVVPDQMISLTSDVSRWCLCIAIAAVGLKTSLSDFKAIGLKPVLLVLGETAFLCTFVILGIVFLL